MAFTKINAAGIGTTETVTVDGLTVINDGSFGGNLTVSGVLTYEDVTNVDSVGLITARNGIVVGSGITLSKDGDIFATGITTVSGNVKVGTGITLSPDGDGFYTGVVTATTFKGDGSQLTGVNSDVVDDTTPQLGGNLDVNTKNIVFGDSGSASDDRLTFGAGTDLSIYHDGSHSYISEQGTGNLRLLTSSVFTVNNAANSKNMILATDGGSVDLYFDGSKKVETNSAGAQISNGTGNAQLNIRGGSNDGTSALQFITDDANANNDSFRLYADGNNELFIQNYSTGSWATNMKVIGGDACKFHFNGSKKLETTSTGVSITGVLDLSSHLDMGDSDVIKLGDGDDFQIYHSGSLNLIDVYTNNLQIRNESSEKMAVFNRNGAVELYYDNSIRLQTTTNGVTAGTPTLSETAVVGAQAGFFGGAKSLYASATGLIQNQVCILDTATSAAAGTGGALTFAGYIDNDSTTYYATIEGVKENSSSNNYAGSLKFLTRSHNVANMNLAMVIDSSGDLIIGGTAVEDQAAITLEPNRDDGAGRITFNRANTSNVSIVLEMQNNNSQVGKIEHDHTSAGLVSVSDYRLKENEVLISDGITRLKQLKPYRFNFKIEPDKTVDGFFAHEVDSVVPEAVSGEKDAVDSDGNMITQGICKEKLVPLLTAALQEAIAKIETLETKVAALEG